jgi:hypothetical protein
MINNFFHSHILCVLVWTNVETLSITEGADGVLIEIGIANAIMQV